MKHPTTFVLTCLLAACGSPADPYATSGKADAPVEQTLTGRYVLDSDRFGGTLTVRFASPERIEFDLNVISQADDGGTVGVIEGGLAVDIDGGQISYWPSDMPVDCEIVFLEVSAEAITLAQVGGCVEAGFGADIDASGTYKREADAPVERTLTGRYVLDSDRFGGTLTVRSASPERIEFDLNVISQANDGGTVGVIEGGLAVDIDGGQISYWPSDMPVDCEIVFLEVSAEAITLAQVGGCVEAGFGADIDASGTYNRQ